MAIVKTDSRYYAEIAAAIREKTGGAETYKPSQMAEAIRALDVVIGLPNGYEQLLYIESTGTQWINTNHCVTSQNLRYQVVMAYTNTNDNGVSFGGGAENAYAISMYGTNPNFWIGRSGSLCTLYVTQGEKMSLDIQANNGALSVAKDGVTKTASYSGTMSSARPISIFAQCVGDSAIQFASIRVYAFKIYDNDTLVRDYIPARNSAGEVGLYDLVGRKFYENAGTGSFIAGGQVVPLPDGYKQLSYIQASGAQWINTDFVPNQNTRVFIKLEYLHQPEVSTFVLGASESTKVNSFEFGGYAGRYLFRYGTKQYYFDYSVAFTDEPFVLDASKKAVTINGSLSLPVTAETFTSPYQMCLGSTNRGRPGTYPPDKLKIYYCQIYDNDTLVRDYVPCQNPENVFGLYDRVTKAFFGNAGTGVFTGG